MIEIVVEKERNLKNLKQIGTPLEENKIYVENLAYSKLRETAYKDKRVFVLMGHTERMEGRYATFVEAVISVGEIEFAGGVPKWNNKIWSNVFREIKRIYEDKIIVGWALDMRGMSPRMTQELERTHREHFGGIHQLMLLMDSLEKEETFYTYKENRLVPKEGFYIYYHSTAAKVPEVQKEIEVVDLNLEVPDIKLFANGLSEYKNTKEQDEEEIVELSVNKGRYRELLNQQQKSKSMETANTGVAVAVALLIFVIGIGAYENRDSIFGKESVPVIEPVVNETEDYIIPVEIISGDTEKSDE